MANNSVVTQQNLQEFYNTKVYPFLNGATHTGCVPLGTILPYFGETAPTHFLICDGTEYAKADYPELAEHLLALTDPTPYVGSDSNHFKVPDLRGEFLRGTGTNSHTNQGNGANVGVHQNATQIPQLAIQNNNLTVFTTSNYDWVRQPDSVIKQATNSVAISGSSSSSTIESIVTSRPTNTSVTFIIAYRNAYIDLALDSFPIDITQPTDGQLLMYDATAGRWVNGGHKYSTDEHVVGTWIDGKPVYERVITGTTNAIGNTNYEDNTNRVTVTLDVSVDKFVFWNGFVMNDTTGTTIPLGIYTFAGDWARCWLRTNISSFPNTIVISTGDNSDVKNRPFNITIRYTKTTDTV